jgi:V/A-type H+-transporting ATPase subunit I
MIVPMKKFTLVVLEADREAALSVLRKTGVMHVEGREAAGQALADLHALTARLDQAYAILFEKKADKKAKLPKLLDRQMTLALADRAFLLRDEYRTAQENIVRLEQELDRFSAWGDVDPSDMDYLKSKGLFLFPFEMSASDYALMPDTLQSIVVNRDKKNVRCIVYGESDTLPAPMPASAKELVLPPASTLTMKKDLALSRQLIPSIVNRLALDALQCESLTALKAEVLKELEFEMIRTGMPIISLGTDALHLPETSLVWLAGYVPVPDKEILVEAAEKHGWAFISDDPAEEDNVPTQIRNNRIVNLISPLLDFLGTVPGYRELDISLWFLVFFGIFFAMIFGDGGYGALLVLISVFSIMKSAAQKKPAATGLYMLLYLGLMTVGWGIATCTWFGMPVASLPQVFRSIAFPAFSNENPDSATNIKIFCFTLGLVQISLAHIIGIVRNIKTIKVLGELGALLLTIGMYFVVLYLVVDKEKYPLSNISLGLIGGGFLLNFLFINYSGSVAGGIVESLKNIITMFLGVVNMFGDIMSYIRLWAVGLAGSAISNTINTMAGPMLGGFIIFAGILLLFFGHGLNLVMNVLSVIVHGVRLNTLEFSNHLGLTWSGFKYEPFSETGKK